jgi:hypothetical protein
VHGEILIGEERIEFEGPGERDHSWGVRDWWAIPWCWTAGRLTDGSAFHASRPFIEGVEFHPGFVIAPGQKLQEIDGFTVETATGAERLPESAEMVLGPLTMSVEPLAHAPVLLTSPEGNVSRFPRSLCRFTSHDGRTGVGWTEWLQREED